MARKVQAGPEAKGGWKEEWSWKDKNGTWRKRVIYGTGTAKVWTQQELPGTQDRQSDRQPGRKRWK